MQFINSSALLVLAITLFLTDTCEGQDIFQLVGLYSSDLEPEEPYLHRIYLNVGSVWLPATSPDASWWHLYFFSHKLSNGADVGFRMIWAIAQFQNKSSPIGVLKWEQKTVIFFYLCTYLFIFLCLLFKILHVIVHISAFFPHWPYSSLPSPCSMP